MTVVAGDAREVPAILDGVSAGIDLSVPVCLIMGFLLHFFTAGPHATWWPGTQPRYHREASWSLTAIHVESQGAEEGFAGYSTAVAPVYNHSVEEFASFFGPLEVLPPGVADARTWSAEAGTAHLPPRDQYAIAGVARI